MRCARATDDARQWRTCADQADCIEKVDEHTIRFILNRPETLFIAHLAIDFALILPAKVSTSVYG